MSYPDLAFRRDHPNQAWADRVLARRSRFALALALASLAAALLFAITGWVPLGVAVLPGWFAAALLYLHRLPRPRCSACGRRMRRQLVALGGGEGEELLLCEPCRRYVADPRRSIGG